MKDENYFTVIGWMANKLGLTGTELLTYAIVYGFTQDGETEYKGSSKYLMETINCSKNTAINALNNLTEKGLIVKITENINGVVFNRYKVNTDRVPKFGTPYQNLDRGIPEIGSTPLLKIGTSNNSNSIYTGNNNKKDISTSLRSVSISKEVSEIVDYLNIKARTSYRSSTDKTRRCINARLNEGWTIDDFKAVIDFKVSQWANTDMALYLRPETLFGTKFENYLQQSKTKTTVYSNPNLKRDNTYDDPEHMWD